MRAVFLRFRLSLAHWLATWQSVQLRLSARPQVESMRTTNRPAGMSLRTCTFLNTVPAGSVSRPAISFINRARVAARSVPIESRRTARYSGVIGGPPRPPAGLFAGAVAGAAAGAAVG